MGYVPGVVLRTGGTFRPVQRVFPLLPNPPCPHPAGPYLLELRGAQAGHEDEAEWSEALSAGAVPKAGGEKVGRESGRVDRTWEAQKDLTIPYPEETLSRPQPHPRSAWGSFFRLFLTHVPRGVLPHPGSIFPANPGLTLSDLLQGFSCLHPHSLPGAGCFQVPRS